MTRRARWVILSEELAGWRFSWVADLVSRVFGGGAEETTDEYSKTMQVGLTEDLQGLQ